MAQKFTLSARSNLMANISAADTSLLVDITKADLFPVADTGTDPVPTVGKDWFKVILEDTSYNKEVVYVRTRTLGSAAMTQLLRGQEGTTARAFLAGGTIVGLRHTPADLGDAISFASSASAFWKTMVGYATAALSRAALGISAFGDSLFTAEDAAAGRTALGVVIGTDVQAYDANTVKKNAANVFTAQQTPVRATATATASASHAWAVGAAQVYELTFGAGNITALTATGAVAGTSYRLRLKQDSVGGRTAAWSGFLFPGGVAPTLSTVANAVDIFDFYYNGSAMECTGQNIGEA